MNKRLRETMEKQQKALSKRVGPGKSLDVKGLLKVSHIFYLSVFYCFWRANQNYVQFKKESSNDL